VFRDVAERSGLGDRVVSTSSGTGDWHVGERADVRTLDALDRRGYDGARHRARQFTLDDFDRLSDHEFKGRRWGWVDPSAEVNAATIAVAHGWRTDAEVASDYGNDIDDDIKEAARIRPEKEAAGLVTLPSGQQPPQPQPQPTTENE
jgi:hypothetical protein